MENLVEWHRMRSEIYLRDRAICWACNAFVDLEQYDLGHLIDQCNNGQNTYDNLVVMHKLCNLSKPTHKTLEEAMKWRLTKGIDALRPSPLAVTRSLPTTFIKRRGRPPQSPNRKKVATPLHKREPTKIITKPHKTYYPSTYEGYEKQVSKIKPSTLAWVQGRPMFRDGYFAPMWRLLPPPYNKDDTFTMRVTPPGAIDNGYSNIQSTLQIIGGGVLTQDVDIELGHLLIHVHAIPNQKPIVTFGKAANSNTGKRGETIGMGYGQIPLSEWRQARKQGISVTDFKAQYLASQHPDVPDAQTSGTAT